MNIFSRQLIQSLPFELNDYQFLKFVGFGSYSVIFDVFSIKYSRHFCAKVTQMDDSLISDDGICDPELAALFNLDHPNVIKFYDYFMMQNNMLVLILDYVKGGTLQKFIGEPIPPKTLQSIIRNISSGLLYCHEQNIAHRDLKPANIFIDDNNHAILADFGFASFQTVVDNQCGSPFYCAPEMFQEKSYDPFSADIFALGVTLYEVITGSLPFTVEQLKENDIEEIDLRKLGMCDARLAKLIRRMLLKDPKERPTMKEVVNSDYLKAENPSGIQIKRRVTISLPKLIPSKEERLQLRSENSRSSHLLKSAFFPVFKSQSIFIKRKISKSNDVLPHPDFSLV